MSPTVPSDHIDEIFAAFARPGSPGAAVAVIHDGAVAFARGYGLADLELGVPITPSTAFNVGSMAKQFTAFAVALLAADRRIGLDDDIRSHLPEMTDFGHRITIRHLVHHTSGLRGSFPELLGLAGWREADVTTTEHVLGLLMRQRELNFPPGEEFQYVNSNYVLLAAICARASGRDFAGFCRDRIFAPLGMDRTTVNDAPEKLIPGRARSYYGDAASGWVNAPLTDAVVGPTNVYTTVEDLARWDRNLATGEIGGREMADLMVRPGIRNDGTELDYAFGLEVGPAHTHGGRPLVEHGGQQGGYCSWMVRFPDTGWSVAVLCNHFTWNTRGYALAVADTVLGDGPAAPAETNASPPGPEQRAAPALPLLPPESDAFCGTYFDAPRAGLRVVDIAGGRLRFEGYDLTPMAEGEFTIDAEPTVRVRFERVSGEPAPAMETRTPSGSYRYERVDVVAPDPASLGAYAGRYDCPELDTSWTITAEEGRLVVHRSRYPDTTLAPAFADAFHDDWEPILGYPYRYLVVFERDGAGAVTGMRVSGTRVRRLRFVRADP